MLACQVMQWDTNLDGAIGTADGKTSGLEVEAEEDGLLVVAFMIILMMMMAHIHPLMLKMSFMMILLVTGFHRCQLPSRPLKESHLRGQQQQPKSRPLFENLSTLELLPPLHNQLQLQQASHLLEGLLIFWVGRQLLPWLNNHQLLMTMTTSTPDLHQLLRQLSHQLSQQLTHQLQEHLTLLISAQHLAMETQVIRNSICLLEFQPLQPQRAPYLLLPPHQLMLHQPDLIC